MTEQLAAHVAAIIKELYGEDIAPVVTRTAVEHGDFACNVAMQLSAKLARPPREIAEAVGEKLRLLPEVADVQIAGPGFINISVSDSFIYTALMQKNDISNEAQTVLLEYSCPNAFKELHTGHLYQTLIGDAVGRIYEFSGSRVVRTSFGGDVGLHAAKCMWGVLKKLGGEFPEKLADVTERPNWISAAYVDGSSAYENDSSAKQEIDALNRRIYDLFKNDDKDSSFAQLFFTLRQWSYDYFDDFYRQIGAEKFDRYYPESETMQPGLELVENHINSVFIESNGAIVLPEETSGLHTRVFITSNGLPTYETKDLGVIQLEYQDFPYDKRVIMTGNDQVQYMQVVFKALELIDPERASKQKHVANGTVRFGDGSKMSSRLGNVSRAIEVIEAVESVVQADSPELKRAIALGAVKYSLLKNRVGGDIAFDLEQSISTEGNSGPYLQYALVRARSILRSYSKDSDESVPNFDEYERKLAIKLTSFNDALQSALVDFSPHHICGFLYELAQEFNRFYEKCRVIDDPRTPIRIQLVKLYENRLAKGLQLLGIPTPEEM